jgi:redox-sensing transcriptional repressor
MEEKNRNIPESAVPRLSRYYRCMFELTDREVVLSDELSSITGFSSAQIRKDLTYFGQFGRPGLGYSIDDLKKALAKVLGIDRVWNVCLIGMGKLAHGLLENSDFPREIFRVLTVFDDDFSGSASVGIRVYPMKQIAGIVPKENIQMAILTLAGEKAQTAVELLVKAGVKAILNFSGQILTVPDHVAVAQMDLTGELHKLAFLTSAAQR